MTEKTNAELVAENEHLCERLRASGENVISLLSTLYGIRAAIEPDAPGKLMLSELAGEVNAMRSRLAAKGPTNE